MATKHMYGLSKVEIAPIASDGDYGSAFVTVGETVAGTANLTSTDPTITDFKIEESDSPVESITTDPAKETFAWSTYVIDADNLVLIYGGTKNTGVVGTLGSITGGSSYTNGTYNGVPLTTSGSGTGAKANFTIAGGAVTALDIVDGGSGYAISDTLAVSAANVGGTGSGFVVSITAVTTSWIAPDSLPDLEKTVRLTARNSNVVTFCRMKISTKLGLSFAKDKLGQLDMTATVLSPTKTGVKKFRIKYAA